MHAESTASTSWQGTLARGSGTTSLASGATAPLEVSWGARTERTAGATSPEELIAAAHASCYAMAFSHELAEAGATPEHLDVSATVTFEMVDGAPTITRSALTVRGRVSGIDAAGVRRGGRGRKGRLPRLARAHGQRRDHARRRARLSRRRSPGRSSARSVQRRVSAWIARQWRRRTIGRKSVNQVIMPAGMRNSSEIGRVSPTATQISPKPPMPSQPMRR